MEPGVSVATMTIVVYFEDAAIGELARDRIGALAHKHPSRVIVLDGTQRGEVENVASGEWTELHVAGTDAESVCSSVASLRVPDAPIVLCWIAPRIGEDDLFCELAPEAKTIVYNSSLVDAGSEALCRLVDYVARHPNLPVSDIAYLRLAPWQESVALLFDGEDAEQLQDIISLDIASGSEPEALYLLGWIASRLGWETRSPQRLSASGRQIAFAMAREGEPRRVRRVALSSTRARFEAEVSEDGATIQLRVTGEPEHPQRYRAVNNPGIAALVERAILSGENDRIFRSALAAAGAFLACGESR